MSHATVIGPGALGCLFAARLARCGVKTTLVDYREERAAVLRKIGITVETAEETYTEKPAIATRIPASCDFILVLTKAHSTRELRLPPKTPTLTLQNGLGNAETLAAAVGASHVLAGATSEAATWLDVGRVRHAASGRTEFGAWTTCPADAPQASLQQAGFDISITESPGKTVWEKVVVNAGINPLTALLNVSNGALLEKRETRELMRDLVVEATRVAGAEGYHFGHSLVEETERICEATRDNISSMLQDIRQKRRTEIGAISGEILRRGQNAMLPTPRTKVIYQLVRALEAE
ncbi:MAG TPA: 2-dehydropantoate 2-reductase [Candidatus Hydrogenedentes bacterium]|nr:2-dehydropantoate 2-reductase [Candidatus Hydrogenedentota bacterium]